MLTFDAVSCAYQCLRMLNYVSQPTVEVIQITLLGMTERMCLVLGLHVETTGFSYEEQAVRRRVW
jgi:hypothetical protein